MPHHFSSVSVRDIKDPVRASCGLNRPPPSPLSHLSFPSGPHVPPTALFYHVLAERVSAESPPGIKSQESKAL